MNLQEWLRADRQWPRRCRIEHARYQFSLAENEDERDFWTQVLIANLDDHKHGNHDNAITEYGHR